jgi:2-succinyl-6-hydroxy-2,4-cyclohexadiene-1-carboxylate synthase
MKLLLHGFTGGTSSWDRLRLADARAVPLLGHERHLVRPSTWRLEVERLADGLSGPAHVVGYSMGARLALGLAVAHPELVARLTLIGVNPGLDDAERPARAAADAGWRRRLDDGMAAFVDAWQAQPLFATQARLPEALRTEERARRLWHSARGLQFALDALGLAVMPDLRPALTALRCPVTLVAGEDDEKFRALAVATAARLPAARVRLVAGAGHNVPLERPRELAAIVEEDHS